MPYATEAFPYDRPTEQMTPGALKKAFAVAMEQMPRRIANISGHLERAHGILISPKSSDEDIDQLPKLIAALGAWREMSEEEFESRLAGTRKQVIEIIRAVMPRKDLNGETLAMAFDAALLWGEAFRIRYPTAYWAIGSKPKSSVDYGEPVLLGYDEYQSEFGVCRQMHGHIAVLMSGDEPNGTLSEIMKIRAYNLGLGPSPWPKFAEE